MWQRFWHAVARAFIAGGQAMMPLVAVHPDLIRDSRPGCGPPPGHPERPAGHLPPTPDELALWRQIELVPPREGRRHV